MAKLAAIGIVVKDMSAALRFYGLLGLDVPTDKAHEDHVEVTLENGLRVMWDTQTLVKSLEPDWVEPAGHRSSQAFLCDSPADVDATHFGRQLQIVALLGRQIVRDGYVELQLLAQTEDATVVGTEQAAVHAEIGEAPVVQLVVREQ